MRKFVSFNSNTGSNVNISIHKSDRFFIIDNYIYKFRI